MKAFPLSAKALSMAVATAGLCLFGCWNSTSSSGGTPGNIAGQDTATRAIAQVRGYTDTAIDGNVLFESTVGDSLFIHGAIAGLTPGKTYGIKAHQNASCSSPEASGGVLGASGVLGTPIDSLNNRPGDLPNLVTDSAGVGHFQVRTRTLRLNDSAGATDTSGSRSVYGHSVVVHSNSGLSSLVPGGLTDTLIACGVIVPLTANLDTTSRSIVDTNKTPGHPPAGGTTGVY